MAVMSLVSCLSALLFFLCIFVVSLRNSVLQSFRSKLIITQSLTEEKEGFTRLKKHFFFVHLCGFFAELCVIIFPLQTNYHTKFHRENKNYTNFLLAINEVYVS
jgi:hypothetical protein